MADELTLRLSENVARVRERVEAAARRAGRDSTQVRLVAVTKYAPLDAVAQLPALGLSDLGENRVQQLASRAEALGGRLPGVEMRWHMIGHLQRNKIRTLLPWARMVQSLDSVRLAEAISVQAVQMGVAVNVLVEVNMAGEASKTGAGPDDAREIAATAARLPGLVLRGLMTMAPYDEDPEASRPYFISLRELLERLRSGGIVGPGCDQLSMGMSQDYAVAIAEGATIVRVGSALFEGIPTTDPRSG